jgi:Xaa-Pro aminopeptidase
LEGGALVLLSAPVLHRSRDTEHRYRPDSELFYLTGCVDPGVVAVFRASEEDGYVIFVPRRDPKAEVWSGPRPGPEAAKEVFGADQAYSLDEMEERLPELLKSERRIFFRLGVQPRVEGLVLGALEWSRARGSRTGTGPRAVEDPGGLLDDLRLVKEPAEISRIRRATDLTVAALEEAMKRTRPGMGEWEVEACLEAAFRRGGCARPAFPTIVGSGENGCTLHYVENGSRVEEGALVLLDGGAEVDLYAGDVTRTYPSGGRFTDRQLDVYQVVLKAHQAALAQIRPGSSAGQIHSAALEELIGGLVQIGVLEGDVTDLLEQKAFEPYFPHQTSHWLGLDVHDVGDYATESGSRTLEPGMVLTVEPGLYFSSRREDESHPFLGTGIRIEDDVLVTEDGVENLTGSLPVSPEGLEALMEAGVRG